MPALVARALALSRADDCIIIAGQQTSVNVRWAGNTVTTNGVSDETWLAVVSIAGGRVGTVTRTYCPPDAVEGVVRESEAACAGKPEAPDAMPLIGGDGQPDGWDAPPAAAGLQALDTLAPRLATMLDRARTGGVETFGYIEHRDSTVWLATSTGLRRRHTDRIAKIELTGKTPDFTRSAWTGAVAGDLGGLEPGALLERLRERLSWSARRIDLPAGEYEVLFEPSCTADLAISAYATLTRREADEGRSPYARAGGGTRIGERLFGALTMYSDPDDAEVPTAPFHVGLTSGSAASVFDNGLPAARTEWVRDGVLRALITPRYWAAKAGAPPVPYIENLIVTGDGPALDEMIARTERALLVTSLWYIRTVDPQTALQTGLTRDGVFLVERGRVVGAVNNFRWNMSSIAAFAQATEIGRSGLALPREHDEFLRAKAPPMRVARFTMSSVSDAS